MNEQTKTQHTPTPVGSFEQIPVKGMGFKPSCGGFDEILIGRQDFPASIVAQRVLVHDDLVAALQSAAESIEQLVRLNRIPANNKGLRDARDALAKAGAA